MPLLIGTVIITGYIGEFEEVDDHRSGKIVIQLNGRYATIMRSANRKIR